MNKSIIEPKRDTFRNLKRDFLFFDLVDFIQEDLEFFIDINITDESYYETLQSTIADIEFLESNNLIRVSNFFDYQSLGLSDFKFDKIQHPIRMNYKEKDNSLEIELERLKRIIFEVASEDITAISLDRKKVNSTQISKIDKILEKNNFDMRLWNFYNN